MISVYIFVFIVALSSTPGLRSKNLDKYAANPSIPERESSLLVIVPGHGSYTRWAIVNASLQSLRKSCNSSKVKFHCTIYAYNQTYTPHLQKINSRENLCDIVESDGFWTHHMLKADVTDHTHIAVLMDDVNTTAVSIPRAIAVMNRYKFDAATVAIKDWHNRFMWPKQNPKCVAHEVNFADVLFMVFTANAWACWQSLIDVDSNDMGWGYDLVFKDRCNVRIGVLDKEIGTHELGHGIKARSYDNKKASLQLLDYIKSIHNLTSRRDARNFVNDQLKHGLVYSPCLTG